MSLIMKKGQADTESEMSAQHPFSSFDPLISNFPSLNKLNSQTQFQVARMDVSSFSSPPTIEVLCPLASPSNGRVHSAVHPGHLEGFDFFCRAANLIMVCCLRCAPGTATAFARCLLSSEEKKIEDGGGKRGIRIISSH